MRIIDPADAGMDGVQEQWRDDVPETASDDIDALAHHLWSIHPRVIQDMGITREQFYAQEIRTFIARMAPSEPASLAALQQRVEYYQQDASAAWDQCEVRRLEAVALQQRVEELERKNAANADHARLANANHDAIAKSLKAAEAREQALVRELETTRVQFEKEQSMIFDRAEKAEAASEEAA